MMVNVLLLMTQKDKVITNKLFVYNQRFASLLAKVCNHRIVAWYEVGKNESCEYDTISPSISDPPIAHRGMKIHWFEKEFTTKPFHNNPSFSI